MKTRIVLLLAALSLPLAAARGQQAPVPPAPATQPQTTIEVQSEPQPGNQTDPNVFVIHTTTREVNLDVVVSDVKGHPVQGLKRDNFKIFDDEKPQRLRGFNEHNGSTNSVTPEFKLPPNTFSNYAPSGNPETSFVILFDSLDTELNYQAMAYLQAKDFLKDLAPGTSVAIFDLNDRMNLVQGFTTDREVLLNALKDKRAQPKASPLLATGNEMWRQQILTDGMATLGRYLAGFSGRKNLIWFTVNIPGSINSRSATISGGTPPGSLAGAGVAGDTVSAAPFTALQETVGAAAGDQRQPLSPGGNPSNPNSGNGLPSNGTAPSTTAAPGSPSNPQPPGGFRPNAFQDLTNLIEDSKGASDILTLSKVVVYTIDPRGLMTPSEQAANPNYRIEQAATEDIAASTGGEAFANRNGLDSIMKEIVAKGSDYYTLTFAPTNLAADGAFRKLRVQTVGEAPRAPGAAPFYLETAGLHLEYRPGYHATKPPTRPTEIDGLKIRNPGSNDDFQLASELGAGLSTLGPGATPAFGEQVQAKENIQVSMTMGQIPPTELVLNASVKPSPTPIKLIKGAALPEGNFLRDKFKRQPYREYDVLFATDVHGLQLPRSPDGLHRGGVEFVAVVYTDQGDVVNSFRVNIELNLREDSYRSLLKNGMGTKHSIAIPVKGNYVIRLGVHDANSDRVGALEFPLSAVNAGVAGLGQEQTAAQNVSSPTTP